MLCWPVYIVGGFFISLLIVDMYQYSWDQLPYHAGLGIFFTGLYYTFCVLFGNEISMAVLFVPVIFVLMFFITSWVFYNSIKAQNCCITCGNKTETATSTNAGTSTGTNATASTNATAGATAGAPIKNPFAEFLNWMLTSQLPSPKPKAKCYK